MDSIRSIADDIYGYRSEQFIDTWWATLNILRDQGEKFREAMDAPLVELLNGNLRGANYLLKERLYRNRTLLPYRARAKLELDEDERDYFDELFSAEDIEIDQVTSEVVPPRGRMLAEARQFIGGLITWTNDREMPRTAYIRDVGIDRKFATKYLVEGTDDAPYTVVPYSLILDYFRAGDDGSYERISKSLGIHLPIATFSRFMRQNKVQLVAVGDQFADRSVRSFQINS